MCVDKFTACSVMFRVIQSQLYIFTVICKGNDCSLLVPMAMNMFIFRPPCTPTALCCCKVKGTDAICSTGAHCQRAQYLSSRHQRTHSGSEAHTPIAPALYSTTYLHGAVLLDKLLVARILKIFLPFYGTHSSIGIAAGYGLDGRGSIPTGACIFSSPHRADRLWGLPSLLSNEYRWLFPRG
jgi:hypothetical protein